MEPVLAGIAPAIARCDGEGHYELFIQEVYV
jgi:hypothetical protein